MAYKYSTGSLRQGDIYFEDDRLGEPTYIDFGMDSISLRPSGSAILNVSASAVGIGTTSPISKLDVAGKIAITAEVATPSAPADGKGWLYTKTDGKIYWQSADVAETDLTSGGGGGGGISFNGSTANGVVTYGNSSTADVEANLIFDGSKLSFPAWNPY